MKPDALEVTPVFGEPIIAPFRSIVSLALSEYRATFSLDSGEKLVLSDFGYAYDDFARRLSHIRNEFLLKNALLAESVRHRGAACAYELSAQGKAAKAGECTARLYGTALVVIPAAGEFLRVPYSSISSVSRGEGSLSLESDLGRITLSGLGYETDTFTAALSSALSEIQKKAQEVVRLLLPEADARTLRAAASLLRDGRAVGKREAEACVPGMWGKMESRLDALGMSEEYAFLQKLARSDGSRVGLKQGISGDTYLWFLIPVWSQDRRAPGNAIAMEASTDTGGRATYFFRIAGRKEYASVGEADLEAKASEAMDMLGRCMAELNFRREPLYLPDEKLEDPRYERYRTAIERIPELREVRRLFVGRVMHASKEAWESGVLRILSFNVSASNDSGKYVASEAKLNSGEAKE